MIQAVIFDMDGVLVDSEPLYEKTYQEIYKYFALTLPKEEREGYVGLAEDKVWHHFKKKYNLLPSVSELIDLKNSVYMTLLLKTQGLRTTEGIESLLLDLKNDGYKLAIASSSSRKVINFVTKKLKLDRYFDFIASAEDVKEGKPSPDIFLHTANHFGLKPQECLVVEDSRNGLLGAKHAGMKCVGYANAHSGNQDLSIADYVVASLKKELQMLVHHHP